MRGGKRPPIVNLALTALVTTLFWIGFESFRSFSLKPAPVVPPDVLSPFSPTLDSASLDELQNRIHLEEFEIGDTSLLTTGQDGGVLIEEVVEEEVEEVEEITVPEATEGGQLQ